MATPEALAKRSAHDDDMSDAATLAVPECDVAVPTAPGLPRGRPGPSALDLAGLAIGLAASATAALSVTQRGWFSAGSGFDVFATVLLVAAPVACVTAGVVVHAARPRNPSGVLIYAIGLALAVWAVAISSKGPAGRYVSTSVVLFRPLLFWAVLAWPIGRLSRADRRWLVVYSAVIACCWSAWVVLDPTGTSAVQPFHNSFAIANLSRLSKALVAFANNVALPAGALIVLVSVARRYRRTPIAARALARATLLAAIAATVGDFALVIINRFLSGLTSHGDGRTLLGGFVALLDEGRFVVVPLLLAWAVLWSRHAAPTSQIRTLELGPAAARVQEAIGLAVGDASARVAYPRGGGWFDGDGLPVRLGGTGRLVTVIERDGEAVAAVDLDEAFDDRPTTVELAVAAAASAMEHDRLVALARSRLREATEARRTIVEVEDAARSRIERDLHDGAQQRLVGLALQASLAERAGHADVALLASGVEAARADLRDLASGVLPSILAERGLAAAIATLAATTPLAVDVHVTLPSALAPDVATAAWFVVAEATANAVKHADASALRIDGGVNGGVLRIRVADDGLGGATVSGSGLRGLDHRARTLGGTLTVDSHAATGTVVQLEVPVQS
jgi:signal transduction histidine kinase